jgi:putative protease
MIDAPPECRAEARREAVSLLAGARGRTGTAGFLVEGFPGGLTETSAPGVVGQPLGLVESAGGGSITFVASGRFHAGDRLRVQPAGGREGRTFTVRGILAGGREGTVGMPGARVTVATPFRFAPGDAIHKIDDGATARTSEAACLRRLAAVPPDRISCNVAVALEGETLAVSGATDDLTFEMKFQVGPLDASRGGSVSDVLRARFSETGDSPFALAGFDASRFPGRFIPPSRLKEIRRSFYEAFGSEALARRDAARTDREGAALRSLSNGKRDDARPVPLLWIGLESADEIAAVDREGIDGFMLPLGEDAVAALPALASRLQPHRDRIAWRLPFWLPGERATAAASAVDALLSAGFRLFEANNPAHFRMLAGKGTTIVAGWRTGAMNASALRSLHEQGAAAAVLSPEDDGENLVELASAQLPVARWVTLFGRVPLMVSRIPVSSAGERALLETDGGDSFELASEDGLTVLRSVRPASITEQRVRLAAAGFEAFVVELAGTPRRERAEAIEAAMRGVPVAGASKFNFDRGPRP